MSMCNILIFAALLLSFMITASVARPYSTLQSNDTVNIHFLRFFVYFIDYIDLTLQQNQIETEKISYLSYRKPQLF